MKKIPLRVRVLSWFLNKLGITASLMPRGCSYNWSTDVFTFHGYKYSGGVLRYMAGSELGKIIRLKERKADGVIIVEALRMAKQPQKKDWIPA